MKKVYEKPVVRVENFELSQHIANCDFNVRGHNSAEECYAVGMDEIYGTEPVKVFMSGKCDVYADEYCYGNMTGATPVFSSF